MTTKIVGRGRTSDQLADSNSYWEQRASMTNAYARKRGASGKLTATQLQEIWTGKCHWCRKAIALGLRRNGLPLATVDHLVRLVGGGKNDETNVVWACRSCNSGRHDPQYQGA